MAMGMPHSAVVVLLLVTVLAPTLLMHVQAARFLSRDEALAWMEQETRAGPSDPKPHGTVAQIVESAYEYLESHLMVGEKWGLPFHYYRPALEKYGPHQWLWDSSSHMMVWSHRNVSNSIADLRTMLQMQQPNGRVPEIIFWGPQSLFDQAMTRLQCSDPRFTDLTQMPLLPFALRAIFNASGGDTSLLREFLPKLVQYQLWWATERVVDGSDVPAIIHGWESGLDASPLYDAPYGVGPQPSFLELYPKFDELVFGLHFKYGWNQSAILQRDGPPFSFLPNGYWVVQDIGVAAVYAAGWGVLAELAAAYDPPTAALCRAWQQRAEAAVLRRWTGDRFLSTFKDRDGRDYPIEERAVQELFPLLLDSVPADIAAALVRRLTNTSAYWLPYPVPSTPADSPAFQPVFSVDLMWRGPTWPMLNWLLTEALVKHGYRAEAETLLDRWTALYVQTGIYEQYNPFTGAPYGVEGLGMSTLIVDWLYRLGRYPASA